MSDELLDAIKIADRLICYRCVKEPFLCAEIKKNGARNTCFYCSKTGKTITIEDMADHIEAAFERHFYRTATDPDDFEYAMLKEGGDWEREGEPVICAISSAAEIDEVPAEDIQKVLEERHSDYESAQMGEECDFDTESYYIEKGSDDKDFRIEWGAFERSIKTEARSFSKSAEAALATIFEGLAEHETRDNKPVIVKAGPKNKLSSLYRARVFQSVAELEEALKRPDRDIGPPPSTVATAGRMNAHGISVFYGAVDPNLALAEVRPPVGSWVVVGRFQLIRAVHLLDMKALQSIYVKGSFFDTAYTYRLERAKFLRGLSDKITQPVMPNDEPIDYLVTQAIADYLSERCDLDGIMYRSVQANAGKSNIVLFHKAALVEPLELPDGTELSAQIYHSTEDGYEIDCNVWEEVPPSKSTTPEVLSGASFHFSAGVDLSEFAVDNDNREPTLRLDMESVSVHQIRRVSIDSETHSVSRRRFEKREPKF